MLPSGMELTHKTLRFVIFALFAAALAATANLAAQNPPVAEPTILDRLNAMISGGKSAWTPEQIAVMERLRTQAMSDTYALDELRHLCDNIGPRLSGSPQAQQAVDYVAGEMRALGATVTLEKAMVPHWVRGVETGEVVAWPGQAPGTSQKIVLTALGAASQLRSPGSPHRWSWSTTGSSFIRSLQTPSREKSWFSTTNSIRNSRRRAADFTRTAEG